MGSSNVNVGNVVGSSNRNNGNAGKFVGRYEGDPSKVNLGSKNGRKGKPSWGPLPNVWTLEVSYSPIVAEAMAILRGIDFAVDSGIWPVVVKSDLLGVVNLIISGSTNLAELGLLSAKLVPGSVSLVADKSLKIGVVLSRGQAPGGHNVISEIFGEALVLASWIFGDGSMSIYGGFDMICSGRDKIETPEQFNQAQEIAIKLDLDGIVVIGGDDSNTTACLLAENFRAKNMKTRVIGCPKTIDGDLKCKEIPTSFGFDTACKVMNLSRFK
ncbi:hypothetical protein LWI28_028262 [Acer negundo]|uniref:Phosphofructokinase domain-containing protein n=1 Tax=Acer negundo TaxID=4023 RepID=A0AAD5IP20_ACENE|nr:hypothetical protein LWI28_028262 [Acer negundo]